MGDLDVEIQEKVITDMVDQMVLPRIIMDALDLDVEIQEIVIMDMEDLMALLQIIMDVLDQDATEEMVLAEMEHPMAILQVVMDAQDLDAGEEMVAMEGQTIFRLATMVDVVDLDVVAAATVDHPVVAGAVAAAEETKEVENLPVSNGSQDLLILG